MCQFWSELTTTAAKGQNNCKSDQCRTRTLKICLFVTGPRRKPGEKEDENRNRARRHLPCAPNLQQVVVPGTSQADLFDLKRPQLVHDHWKTQALGRGHVREPNAHLHSRENRQKGRRSVTVIQP